MIRRPSGIGSTGRRSAIPFNMTRQPAASIPCGLTRAGLPIGLQIVGPLYADARVLRAARAFETTQPERRPPLAAFEHSDIALARSLRPD